MAAAAEAVVVDATTLLLPPTTHLFLVSANFPYISHQFPRADRCLFRILGGREPRLAYRMGIVDFFGFFPLARASFSFCAQFIWEGGGA